MSSGLPAAKWNNADIVSDDVAVAELTEWYASRDVPWGLRVPLGLKFALGTPAFEKRCAGLVEASFVRWPAPRGIALTRATTGDLAAYAAVELAAFGGDPDLETRWLEPALGTPGYEHWMAKRQDATVGVAMFVRTDGVAGPAAYVAGVAALPDPDSQSIGAALVSQLVSSAFRSGAALVHTNPDPGSEWLTDLGFAEVPGFLVRVVRGD